MGDDNQGKVFSYVLSIEQRRSEVDSGCLPQELERVYLFVDFCVRLCRKRCGVVAKGGVVKQLSPPRTE